MCLSKVRERMRRNRYASVEHFYLEFCMIFKNALTYNLEDSPVCHDALFLKSELEAAILKQFPDFITHRLDDCEALLIAIEEKFQRKHARDDSGKAEGSRKRTNLTPKAFHCTECGSGFSRPNNLKRHILQLHGPGASEPKPANSTADAAAETERRRVMKESPYPLAAQHVLRHYSNGTPMHYRDITKKAIELAMIKPQGRTPENTMHGQLNKCDWFVPDGRGLYRLRAPDTDPPGASSPKAGAGQASGLGGQSPMAEDPISEVEDEVIFFIDPLCFCVDKKESKKNFFLKYIVAIRC